MKQKRLKVLCLSQYQPNISPSMRYRIQQYLPLLAESNIDIVFAPFASHHLQSVLYRYGFTAKKVLYIIESIVRWIPKLLQHADIILVQRGASLIGPPIVERLLAQYKPMVFDFDDAIFLHTPSKYSGMWANIVRPKRKAEYLMRYSDSVMAGNEYLASYARLYNSQVFVVPTALDTQKYTPSTKSTQALLTIGWIGTPATTSFIEPIIPALTTLADILPFRFLTVGADKPLTIPNIECEHRSWSDQKEIADFQDIDIGLYPIPENEWSKGKCGLKAIQYGSVAIPTVCTPFGVNRQIVMHEVTGLYARTNNEWIQAISTLILDSKMRNTMGIKARQFIQDHYDIDIYARTIADILWNTYEQKSKKV